MSAGPPTSTGPETVLPALPRRHDLDALRAFAMLLGIVLHAALSLSTIPWIVQDRFRSTGYDVLVAAIHGFRMPLFFLLSGFFTAMLWQRRGTRGLLAHRGRRIALPLLLGCLTIVPLTFGVSLVAAIVAGSPAAGIAGDDGAPPPDTARDVWTAAAYGDRSAVATHLDGDVPIDGLDPIFGQSALGWAVLGDQPDVVNDLLAAGADPGGRYRDGNTPLHTAAFFGRTEAAIRLLAAGSPADARNDRGETPDMLLDSDAGTTRFIAGILQVPVDMDAVRAGREEIRPRLVAALAAASPDADADTDTDATPAAPPRSAAAILRGLMEMPFFQHLWFLWFLCWLVLGFVLVAPPLAPHGRRAARLAPAVTTPWRLLWLVPLTMIPQAIMHGGGTLPGIGPDTSAGLVPMPHVLGYYAIFFGFGALAQLTAGGAESLSRGWIIQLPLGAIMLPVAFHLGGTLPNFADAPAARLGFLLAQVLYAWLLSFGLIGLFAVILHRPRRWVRYASDSSYWLYLAHLPLILVGQLALRSSAMPAGLKLLLLVAGSSVLLLASYAVIVRPTALGRLLNGPRPARAPD